MDCYLIPSVNSVNQIKTNSISFSYGITFLVMELFGCPTTKLKASHSKGEWLNTLLWHQQDVHKLHKQRIILAVPGLPLNVRCFGEFFIFLHYWNMMRNKICHGQVHLVYCFQSVLWSPFFLSPFSFLPSKSYELKVNSLCLKIFYLVTNEVKRVKFSWNMFSNLI